MRNTSLPFYFYSYFPILFVRVMLLLVPALSRKDEEKRKEKNGKGREKASLPRDTRKHHRGEGRPVPGEALRLRVLGGAWIVRSNLLAKDRPC